MTLLPGAHGNHRESITSVGPNRVDVQVTLDACSGKHMGIIDFCVKFKQIQLTTQDILTQKEVNLKWGDADVLPLVDSTGATLMQIEFNAYDGTRTVFGPVTDLTSSRYIKVMNQGSNLQIKAEIPTRFYFTKSLNRWEGTRPWEPSLFHYPS